MTLNSNFISSIRQPADGEIKPLKQAHISKIQTVKQKVNKGDKPKK